MLAKYNGIIRDEEPYLEKGGIYSVYFRVDSDHLFPGMGYVVEVSPSTYDMELGRYVYMHIGYRTIEDVLTDWEVCE